MKLAGRLMGKWEQFMTPSMEVNEMRNKENSPIEGGRHCLAFDTLFRSRFGGFLCTYGRRLDFWEMVPHHLT